MTSFRRNSIKDFLIVSFFSALFVSRLEQRSGNNTVSISKQRPRTSFQSQRKKNVENNKKRRSCYTLHDYKTSFNLDLYIRVNHSTIWNEKTKLNGSLFFALRLSLSGVHFTLLCLCLSLHQYWRWRKLPLVLLVYILLRALIYQQCLLQLSTNAKTSDLVWSTVIVKSLLFYMRSLCVCVSWFEENLKRKHDSDGSFLWCAPRFWFAIVEHANCNAKRGSDAH